ncbi:helix-turn-helix transcriptional regulator [Elioraea rosea]|uniref:helix-turn-helix transcriptional regulator n=1 Tax=Elioraea rosea TaxID=2492390 RepID=UPI001315A108|nr:helix-turn-helix transcriptional regulator [Elioraea rosea]
MAEPAAAPGRLIDAIEKAALEPALWPSVLGELADLVGAAGASIFTLERASRRAAGLSVGDHVTARRAWAGHYAGVRFPPQGSSLPATGVVFSDAEVAAMSLPRSNPYLDDLGQSRNFYGGATTLVTNMLEAGPTSATLTLSRSVRFGRFGEPDAGRLAPLVPHLVRALRTSLRVATLADEFAALRHVLEEMPSPILLVGPQCELRFANQAARGLLDAQDGLREAADGLHAGTPYETDMLRRRVAEASVPAGDASGWVYDERPVLLRRRGGSPLSVAIRPVGANGPQGGLTASARRVMLIVSLADHAPTVTADALRAAYSLTQAEARLALRIANGETLGAAAGALGISLTTAKTHLQRVFDKTGTHRQAELVRLLIGGGTKRAPS